MEFNEDFCKLPNPLPIQILKLLIINKRSNEQNHRSLNTNYMISTRNSKQESNDALNSVLH